MLFAIYIKGSAYLIAVKGSHYSNPGASSNNIYYEVIFSFLVFLVVPLQPEHWNRKLKGVRRTANSEQRRVVWDHELLVLPPLDHTMVLGSLTWGRFHDCQILNLDPLLSTINSLLPFNPHCPYSSEANFWLRRQNDWGGSARARLSSVAFYDEESIIENSPNHTQ